ncbi:MAG: Flp family type IVb pilin [Novosphingobium sp.]|jgi:Flp pilus assembly pilin Flp|uniref:Flp family type IVb pilin n=1 Tax=Novosphingobium sp. TaxID=1874826 RepID=UPI00391AAAC4
MKIEFLMHLIRDERGTSAVEMGLICALIVMAMFTAIQSFANTSKDMWTNVASKVSASNQAATGG